VVACNSTYNIIVSTSATGGVFETQGCPTTSNNLNQQQKNMAAVIESNDAAMPPEQKYFVEAAKRKRTDGTKQFEQLHFSSNSRLRSLAVDPWAKHAELDKLPSPISDGGRTKFLILGAGIGGIVMAITLIKKGFTADQIVIVEAAGGVGGTWYWNRYPGLHCKHSQLKIWYCTH
jgi:heterodisulfide reductase subunit A-like polyferredoxin